MQKSILKCTVQIAHKNVAEGFELNVWICDFKQFILVNHFHYQWFLFWI